MISRGEIRYRGPALTDVAYREEEFPALQLARPGRFMRRVGTGLLLVVPAVILALLFAPWRQAVYGEGSVVAFDPFERVQPVEAPIKGRVALRGEGVQENAYVEENQLLFRIEDQDPLYLTRLELQVSYAENDLETARRRLEQAQALKKTNERIVEFATGELESMRSSITELIAAYDFFVEQAQNKLGAERGKLTAAEAKRWQAEADYQRKKNLSGIGAESTLKLQEAEQKYRDAEAYVRVAQQDVENARNGVEGKKRERESKRTEGAAKLRKIEQQLQKARAEIAKADIDIEKTNGDIYQKQTKLLEQQRKFEAQRSGEVLAPRDGYVMNLAVFDESSIVKPGEQLCRIVPRTAQPAVQIWVAGNDAPLISPGRKVRLQFESYPAVQIPGWPSVAMGTFGGVVALVDPTDDGAGKFRVVVTPDPDDSEWPSLRQGVRANGWVQLDEVSLGWEVWRRLNGFPPLQKFEKGEDGKPKAKPPKIKI